jgi:hypothetical protein
MGNPFEDTAHMLSNTTRLVYVTFETKLFLVRILLVIEQRTTMELTFRFLTFGVRMHSRSTVSSVSITETFSIHYRYLNKIGGDVSEKIFYFLGPT